MSTIVAQICIRRDTAANFTSANPTLALGEIAYETDTRNIKVGDGATAWTALPYINPYRGGTAAAPTSNTVLGSGAGVALTGSSLDNTLLGFGAGANVTGGRQVSIGYQAGSATGAATEHVNIGWQAGQNAASGNRSVHAGFRAGWNNGGSNNVAIGGRASQSTCSNVVAVGSDAALFNTANDITAVGANALDANTSGARNVAVGKDALGANTSAADNVAVGHNALSSMQGVLSGNVAIGTNALAANVGNVSHAPIGSVAIGLDAAKSLTTGSRNVAVGATAMYNATTARGCTAVGPGAMRDGTGGLFNTVVGSDAGQNLTGSANACFGTASGANLTSGNFNVVLGGTDTENVSGTGTTLTTGSANILIGRVDVPSGSTSNSIVIAGRSYGAQWVGDGSNTTVIGNTDTTSTRIPAGNLTLTNGNFIVGTSGKGIDFSATSEGTGTMTSELLSDYEEGTWTPTITFGGASAGMTFGSRGGTYTKIGNRVIASATMFLSNKGTSTGTALVAGLPFVCPNYIPGSVDMNGVTFADQYTMVTNASDTTLQLLECTNAGAQTVLTHTDFSNTSGVLVNITYYV